MVAHFVKNNFINIRSIATKALEEVAHFCIMSTTSSGSTILEGITEAVL